jgi:hypothetical protein
MITLTPALSDKMTLNTAQTVTGDKTFSGMLRHTGGSFGVFGVAAAAQPAGNVDVLAGLVTLGLRAASANPNLNLGTGTFIGGGVYSTVAGNFLSNTMDPYTGSQLSFNTGGAVRFLVRSDQVGFTVPIRPAGQNPALPAAIMQGEAGQSVDIAQAKTSDLVVHFAVSKEGLPKWSAAGDIQATVGAAGAAAAPPATPSTYLKVYAGATAYVVPAYLAA